jgi:hypothetical protein
MESMADKWMQAGQNSRNKQHKQKYYLAAIRLLENGWRNRAIFLVSPEYDQRYFYFTSLRAARAALATLNAGIAGYQKRANAGDADAAYHVGVYYFWVSLDQRNRKIWERRASELGDPEFAGWGIHVDSDAIAVRDVKRAMTNDSLIARLGDSWTQRVIRHELANRMKIVRNRT